MIVRSIDSNGDWKFGKGRNDYLKNRRAVQQNIETRLKMFLGDCFFALNQGIDWFNLLGSKNILELRLSVASVILNTEFVSGIEELSFNIDTSRNLFIQYDVSTSFGAQSVISGTVEIEIGESILTEDGFSILLE